MMRQVVTLMRVANEVVKFVGTIGMPMHVFPVRGANHAAVTVFVQDLLRLRGQAKSLPFQQMFDQILKLLANR